MKKFTGKEYLMIDIANSYGLDKENWDVRLSWVAEHEDHLEDLIKKADDPAMYYAGVKAFRNMDKEIQYPISLDATSSGIQILSVLLGDKKAAEHCNVINVDGRRDIYTDLYHEMLHEVGSDNAAIDRESVKKSIMTSCYGSVKKPKEVFGEQMYPTFVEVMNKELPLIWEFNQACLEMWNPKWESYGWIMPDNFHVNIKVEGIDKETIYINYEPIEITYKVQKPQKNGRSISANITHAVDSLIVREMVRRCMFDSSRIDYVTKVCINYIKYGRIKQREERSRDNLLKGLWKHYQESGFLSARVLELIDSYNIQLIDPKKVIQLIGTLPEKPFDIIPTHDCFRCHPNYGNDVRQQYINILAELHQSDLLQYILRQLTDSNITVYKGADFTVDILNSEYALS